MIKNKDQVVKHFGYWPQFCDAKFTRFIYDKSGHIELAIFYVDAEQSKQASITIVFGGVTDIELSNLLSENVIDEISITDNTPYTVAIDGCYGLNGSFKCTDIEVTNVST